jgi:hypothetical protein
MACDPKTPEQIVRFDSRPMAPMGRRSPGRFSPTESTALPSAIADTG